jgi:Uncharacterized protein with a bacterial SH3 domain homologue
MRKVALLMLVVLVLSMLFSGCGSKSSDNDVISGKDRPSQDSADVEDEKDEDSNEVIRPFTDQGVYEYIDHVLKTYSRNFVFKDLEEILDDPLYYLAYTNLTKDYTVVRYEDLSEYLSDAELKEFSEKLDYNISILDWATDYDDFHYIVQDVDDKQKGIDELWGKGRIDIKDILDNLFVSDGYSYLSKNGILINSVGHDPTDDSIRENTYYEIMEINMEGDTAKVCANYIVLSAYGYDGQKHLTVDLSDFRTIGSRIYEEDWSRRYRNASFDEFVSQVGIDKKTLGEYEISIKNTSSGPVLNGFKVVDHKNFSSDLVIPESLPAYIPYRFVIPDAGLNLRTGPGTEYDVITLIPQGLIINELGNNGDREDWLFVSCTIDGTEYFGWVNSEYAIYYGD